MSMEPETVVEFQKRRSRTWHAVRLWILLAIAGIIGFLVPFCTNPAVKCVHRGFGSSKCSLSLDDLAMWQLNLTFGSLIAIVISIIVVTVVVRRYYRCPRCEAVPLGSWSTLGPSNFGMQRGVALNPSVCSNCGTRLR